MATRRSAAERQASVPPAHPGGRPAITVVMGTRNRCDATVATLRRLRGLPEAPRIIVVDDGSSDGTAAAVREAFDDVVVLRLGTSRGVAAARNVGVRTASTPYVAFADDDSWWAPGALSRAVQLFEEHPRLGAVAARVLVGEDQRLDPVCVAMAASPLVSEGLPGPRVLGFVACGSVVRRDAYLAVGGFPDAYVIGGEEAALALALAAAGWDVAYVDDVIAHHAPDDGPRDHGARQRNMTRNDLWTAWRYRRASGALRETLRILRCVDSVARLQGVAQAVAGLPDALRRRRPVPRTVEAQRRLLDGG